MSNKRKPASTTKAPRFSTTDGFLSANPTIDKSGPHTKQRLLSGQERFGQNEGFHGRSRSVAEQARGRRHKRLPGRGIVLNVPPATPNSRERKHHWRRNFLRTSLVTGLFILVIGGFLGAKGYLNLNKVLKGGGGAAALETDVDPTKLRGEGDGRINVLLLGKGGPGHTAPDLTDTLLVASVDPIHKEAALLSIPRDLYVKSPAGQSKINSVYANAKSASLDRANKNSNSKAKDAENAGVAAIQTTVEQSLGIPIHYYVMVDFIAFQKAIDTVGGVTIDVKKPLYDPSVAWENNNNPLLAATGLQNFNGKKALLYARSRNGSERGDFDRTERQREILLGLKSKVLSVGTFANPIKINQLVSNFGDHAQSNLSTDEVLRLYSLAKDIDGSKVASIGLADPPNDYVVTDNVNGLSIVRPRAGLFDFSEIQSYVRNSLKDGFLRKENATILVLNGTETTGLAAKKAAELKAFGYNLAEPADAPTKTYQKTTVINLKGDAKKYTRHYLEQRFDVTSVTALPDPAIQPGTADFVIIIGQQ